MSRVNGIRIDLNRTGPAETLVRQKLADDEARSKPVHPMGVTVTKEELELRQRLMRENGWTARETQVFALHVLDALLRDAKADSSLRDLAAYAGAPTIGDRRTDLTVGAAKCHGAPK